MQGTPDSVDIHPELSSYPSVSPSVGSEPSCCGNVFCLKPPGPLRDASALQMSRNRPLVDAEEGGERDEGCAVLVLGSKEVYLRWFEPALRAERDWLTLARDVREYLRCLDDLVEAVDGTDRPSNLCTKV